MPKVRPQTTGINTPKKMSVRRHHLYWIKGLLIAHFRHPINNKDISRLTGIPYYALQRMIKGQQNGGMLTINRLMTLRDYGIMIHLEDFQQLEPPPLPPSPKSSPF